MKLKKALVFPALITILSCITLLCGCENQQPTTSSNVPQNNSVQNQANSTEKKLGAITFLTYEQTLEKKLFKAIKHDNLAAVKELVAQGANINAYDKKHQHTAVEAAGKIVFDGGGSLTSSPSADLDMILDRNDKKTPQELILWYLIEHGASLDKCEWLIRKIVQSGNISFVKLLIEKDVDLGKYKGILLDAANSKNEEVFRLVLSKNPDINYQNDDGTTALMEAVSRHYDCDSFGNEAIVKLLLNLGADVNLKNIYGGSALAFAMEDASVAIIKLLLQNKANIHDPKRLMHVAVLASCDQEEKIKLLLDNGYSLEEKDKDGQTPLHWSIGTKASAWRYLPNPGTTRALLKNGAHVNATDNKGRTPLINHILNADSTYFDLERIKNTILILLEFGIDLSIKDNDGKRAEDYLQEHMKNIDDPKFTMAYELLKKNG